MAFSANPLSLSVPQPALESWLRDCGYLELLDDRHAHSSSLDERTGFVTTIFSFVSVYPFARLTADDFAGKTPSWTSQFFDSGEGFFNSYSWPSGASQVRMRIQENVKRYARNYACLSLLVLACCLYQMPIALVGVILTLALWDLFKICSSKWRLERYPLVHYIILFLVRCGMGERTYAGHKKNLMVVDFGRCIARDTEAEIRIGIGPNDMRSDTEILIHGAASSLDFVAIGVAEIWRYSNSIILV